MSEKTPGQVNFETWRDYINPRSTQVWDGENGFGRFDLEKRAWEAGAVAVRKPLLERISELEAEVTTLRRQTSRRCVQCDNPVSVFGECSTCGTILSP